jgi:hypothetical protein
MRLTDGDIQASLFFIVPMLILLLVIVAPSCAEGATGEATAELSWDHPTQRENGEELPVDALAGYELEVKGPDRQKVINLDVVTEYADTASYPYGEITVQYRLRAVDTFGLKGQWSDPAEYTTTVKPEAAPAAPSLNLQDGSAGSSVP